MLRRNNMGKKIRKCAICDEPLNYEGECPAGCTEDELYGIMSEYEEEVEDDESDFYDEYLDK